MEKYIKALYCLAWFLPNLQLYKPNSSIDPGERMAYCSNPTQWGNAGAGNDSSNFTPAYNGFLYKSCCTEQYI